MKENGEIEITCPSCGKKTKEKVLKNQITIKGEQERVIYIREHKRDKKRKCSKSNEMIYA